MLLLQTLQTHQLPIPPLERHQLTMRPSLDHLPFLDYIYHIRLLYRTQAMSDRDCRPSLCSDIQRVLDHLLRLAVECRGRFIEE